LLFNVFILLAGENRGELRQVYRDRKGQHFFYWQGLRHPKKMFLSDYIDDSGVKRSPNASNRALKQWRALSEPITPQSLFIDDEVGFNTFLV